MTGYAGFYINLDRSPEHRAAMEAEFARYKISPYTRFRAANGNSLNLANPHLKEGEMGCFTSHYLLLKENAETGGAIHVVEDDVLLCSGTEQAVRWIIAQDFKDYDIVYTDVVVPLLNDAYKAYKKFYDAAVRRDAQGNISSVAFNIVDLKGLIFGSTSSYLVNPKSASKLHDLYAAEISAAPRQPNDLFIRRLCNDGVLKVGCLFPFVTSVRLDHILATNIDRSNHENSVLATHLARYSFFIGADLEKCREYLEKFIPLPAPEDTHAQILTHLLSYSLTDHYRSF